MAGISITALLFTTLAATGVGGDRLYGRVTTDDGRVVQGYLRWDQNEAAPWDFLDADRSIEPDVLREAERLDPIFAREERERRSIVAFGMRIAWDEDDLAGPPSYAAPIRIGHIATLEPVGGRRALLTLRDGSTVELVGSSTDLGPSMRGLYVDTSPRTESVRVRWRNLVRVEFLDPPVGTTPTARRIYGTVSTWSGLELSGWIAWDRDEVLETDVLDGRTGTEEYELPFSEIASIAPAGRRSATVVLRSGETLELRGTNDVDRSNRGIEISAPGFGRAIVSWEALEVTRFHDAPAGEIHAPALGRIRGTVHATDGRVLMGTLRWGHEEDRTWDVLDGWFDDVEVDLEFGSIARIRRDGEAAEVTLHDGRVLRLGGTSDVGEGHRGVYVRTDRGTTRLVRWSDVDRVELER